MRRRKGVGQNVALRRDCGSHLRNGDFTVCLADADGEGGLARVHVQNGVRPAVGTGHGDGYPVVGSGRKVFGGGCGKKPQRDIGAENGGYRGRNMDLNGIHFPKTSGHDDFPQSGEYRNEAVGVEDGDGKLAASAGFRQTRDFLLRYGVQRGDGEWLLGVDEPWNPEVTILSFRKIEDGNGAFRRKVRIRSCDVCEGGE